MRAFGSALVAVAVLLAALPGEDALYEDLLRHAGPLEKLELLRELNLSGAATSTELSDLFLKPPIPGVREALLELAPLDFIRKERWLEQVNVGSLSAAERRALWKRGIKEPKFRHGLGVNLLEVSAKYFTSAEDPERALILSLHGDANSTLLEEPAMKLPEAYADPDVLDYLDRMRANLDPARLVHLEGEGGMVAAAKLRALRRVALGNPDFSSFDASSSPTVRRLALEGRAAGVLQKALADSSAWVRAGAAEGLMIAWRPDVAEAFLAQKPWVQHEAILKGMLRHAETIHATWVAQAWSKASREGKFTLAEFMARHPRQEWWDLLRQAMEQEAANRDIVLQQFKSMPPSGHSDWLLKFVEREEIKDELVSMAFRVLYLWSEPIAGARYVSLFNERGYRKGGFGGGDLLKLVGKSKVPEGVDIISVHLHHYLENPYAMEAVEAAGWHGDPVFEKRLLDYYTASFEELADPLAKWAVLRCRGQQPSLPVKDRPQPRRAVASFKAVE